MAQLTMAPAARQSQHEQRFDLLAGQFSQCQIDRHLGRARKSASDEVQHQAALGTCRNIEFAIGHGAQYINYQKNSELFQQ